MTNSNEMSTPITLLTNRAIPVTPPSIKPLGNKKAFKPILARIIPSAI